MPTDLNRMAPPLLDVLRLDEAGFAAQFAGSPVMRLRRERLVRNACVAAGNWGDPSALPALLDLLADPSPLVRGHAVWAVGQIGEPRTIPAIRSALHAEADADARAELHAALARVMNDVDGPPHP
jgi:epoxyqueuosine reductase